MSTDALLRSGASVFRLLSLHPPPPELSPEDDDDGEHAEVYSFADAEGVDPPPHATAQGEEGGAPLRRSVTTGSVRLGFRGSGDVAHDGGGRDPPGVVLAPPRLSSFSLPVGSRAAALHLPSESPV